MAVTHYTLTCDFGTLLGTAYDPTLAPVVVSIETNVADNEGIVDTAANLILLGPVRSTANVNGVVTFENLIGSDSSPDDINLAAGTLQYRVSADYVNSMTRRRGARWLSGWFSLTADIDLADILPVQYIPATYISQAVELLQTYVDEAEYWAKLAHDISDIDTSDDVVALLIQDDDSATTAALEDRFALTGDTGIGDANTDVVYLQSLVVEVDTRNATFGYTGSALTTVTERNGATPLRTTTLGYTGLNITTIVEAGAGKTVTTTLTYDGSNNLIGQTRAVA